MESPASAQTSEIPTDTSVGHVVFGQSLKMFALRHVLQTLECAVLEPQTALAAFKELRVSFDGCDPEACAKKTTFIRSLGPHSPAILQFPIGRMPEIAQLFEANPTLRMHQGTIFDPDVQVFQNYWRSLHRLRRFLGNNGPESIADNLTEPIKTRLPELLRYVTFLQEEELAKRLIYLVELLEAKIDGWLQAKSSGDTVSLRARLADWSAAKAPRIGLSPPGPLNGFCALVCDLDAKLETTVAELPERIAPHQYLVWQKHLTSLQ